MADGGVATGLVLVKPDQMKDEGRHEAAGIELRFEGNYKTIQRAIFETGRRRILNAPVEKFPLFGSGSQPVNDRTLALWLVENSPFGDRRVPFIIFISGDRGWYNKRVIFSSSPQQADVHFKWSYPPADISLTFKPNRGSLTFGGETLAISAGNVIHATLSKGGSLENVRILGSTHLEPKRPVESALEATGVTEELQKGALPN